MNYDNRFSIQFQIKFLYVKKRYIVITIASIAFLKLKIKIKEIDLINKF